MGVAHHASYAPWLEMGRTDLLRASGVSYARLEREGVFLVIAKLELSYKRPVRYDDVVEVRTTWKGGGKVKIEHEYEVWVVERALDPLGAIRAHPHAPGSSELCATARTLLACVDREGRLRPLPEWLAV
jgi:acyl-CoA thioester hydrolase